RGTRLVRGGRAAIPGPPIVGARPGGPGSSGVDALRSRGPQLSELGGGRFDVVSWDPRGTGASTPVRCFGDSVPTVPAEFYASRPVPPDPAGQAAYSAEATDFAQACTTLSGDLLRHVSTADTARDLERLRELAGDPTLTYYGESYGSFLGQTYANLFPTRVRAMALDSIVDPIAYTAGAEDRLANTMADTDRVLAEFARLCEGAGPVACALAGTGPVHERITGILDGLSDAALPAPSASPPGELTYGAALVALYSYLSGPANWPAMAQGLADAATGDGSALLEQARTLFPTLPEILPPSAALACADSPARAAPADWPAQLDRLKSLTPIYGPLLTWWLWAPCASWTTVAANSYTGPWNAVTPNPVLVIGTTHDPNTPYRNAQSVAGLLGNAVLLTHDGYGHVSVSDPSVCVDRAVREYLVDLRPPPNGSVCPSDRLPFDPAFGE
ncbi:alpha/beta hydrolase, partial [Mycobacterium sp. CBMA295]